MISYETLFSKKDDGPDSVTHKLALRFSHLYKQQQSDREKHYGIMKKIYNTRSAIVHGKGGLSQDELTTCIRDMEEYMRNALGIYLRKLKNVEFKHDLVIQELDFG